MEEDAPTPPADPATRNEILFIIFPSDIISDQEQNMEAKSCD